MTTLFDNYALSNVCKNKFKIPSASVADNNHLIVEFLKTFTSCIRYPCLNFNSYKKFITNLVPFPRIHFMIPSMGNLQPKWLGNYQLIDHKFMIESLFDCKNVLLDVNPSLGKYFTFGTVFRSTTISSIDVNRHLRMYEE